MFNEPDLLEKERYFQEFENIFTNEKKHTKLDPAIAEEIRKRIEETDISSVSSDQ